MRTNIIRESDSIGDASISLFFYAHVPSHEKS